MYEPWDCQGCGYGPTTIPSEHYYDNDYVDDYNYVNDDYAYENQHTYYTNDTYNPYAQDDIHPIDAFDLTDVDESYDDLRQPITQSHSRTHSESTSFPMDLTRLGAFYQEYFPNDGEEEQEDYTELSSAQETPVYEGDLAAYHQAYQNVQLKTPSPPTPYTPFQIYGQTYYIDDHGRRVVSPSRKSPKKVASPKNMMSPSHEGSPRRAKSPHHHHYPTPAAAANRLQVASPSSHDLFPSPSDADSFGNYAYNVAEDMDHVRDSAVVVHPMSTSHSMETSTLSTTHKDSYYSRSARTSQYNRVKGWLAHQQEVEAAAAGYYPIPPHYYAVNHHHTEEVIDLSTLDASSSHNMPSLVSSSLDTKDDQLFDRHCRSQQPADTSTVAASTILRDDERDEIRSCGTLPSSDAPIVKTIKQANGDYHLEIQRRDGKIHQQTIHSPGAITKKSSLKNKSANKKAKKPKKSVRLLVVEEPSVASDEPSVVVYPYWSRESQPDRGHPVDDGNCSGNQSSAANKESPMLRDFDGTVRSQGINNANSDGQDDAASYQTEESAESFINTVVDRREWLGNFVTELFSNKDGINCKAIYYATSIAENLQVREARNTQGTQLEAYTDLKDYCQYILENMDLTTILENIDKGVYDEFMEDFQDDLDVCIENAMDKYEIFMEHERRKWNSHYNSNSNNDDEDVTTKERREELRWFAGEQLMRQIDTDFKMQLLDHVCYQIGKRQKKMKQHSQF